ncbi:MAG: MATE family efflux transporter, partial [Bacteroidales bacterium]|nr:MATE family efflux transporter [Bacteroidales bacterium]
LITIGLGVAVMTFMAMIMYVTAPYLMSLMTPDLVVQDLATRVLRIEAFVEPFYAASIVAYSVFVGFGQTIKPCVLNLLSIWCVRITLAVYLASSMGLVGVWIAMAVELTFRGLIQTIALVPVLNNKQTKTS